MRSTGHAWWNRKSRPARILSILLLLTLIAASCDGDNGDGGGGTGGGGIGGGTGGGGNETVDLVCAVLGSEPAGDLGEAAITRMVKKVSGGRFQGTLAAAIIVEAVDLGCNEFVRSAVEATKSFLADHPDNIQLAKLGGYKVLDVEESIIALELSIDTADVRSLVDYICADLDGTRNSDPVKDLQAFVIDADLSDLNAVNGIVEQVISTCPSVVGPLEADGLTSTFFTYLLSNEFPDDVTPPTFTSFAWNWGNEPNTIRLYWTLWEPADVSAFELQVLHGGDWSAIEVFRSGTPLSPVYTTDYYRFALRAFDAAGNVSPWHFLDPCVSC